jgi:transcription antitermination factor NusA-like protein
MSYIICDICAKSGILCSACEKKLQEGNITKLEVDLVQTLFKLTKGEVGFERAIELESAVIIFAKKGDIGKIIGKKGVHIRELSKKTGKNVRVVGTDNARDAIFDFIAPARVKDMRRVFLPGGDELTRVTIDKADEQKLRLKPEEIQKIITALTNTKSEIRFE